MQSEVEKEAGISSVMVAAHELKAPLGIIRQLGLTLMTLHDQPMQERLLSELVEVSERALRQVQDLTKIPHLQERAVLCQPVSVRAVCNDVMKEMCPVFQQERRNLQVKYINRSRLAMANPDLLYSIIYNFCTNAVRYSEENSTSYLLVRDHRDRVRVGVRDFGPALPPAVWRELQAGKLARPLPVAMRPDSSGLGFYIISQFADAMQAEFGAVRHRDGASFFVDLLAPQQAELAL